MVIRRPNRTRAQMLEHLTEQRRLAAADLDVSALRLEALDRSIDALRTGKKIDACELELARETEDEIRGVS